MQYSISRKNTQIAKLQREVETPQATRALLQETGMKDLEAFSSTISALAMVWQCARDDAHKVKKWLEDGAEDAVRCLPQLRFLRVLSPQSATEYPKVYADLCRQGCSRVPHHVAVHVGVCGRCYEVGHPAVFCVDEVRTRE